MGEPEAVQVFFDATNNRFGLKPTSPSMRNAFPMGSQGKRGGRRVYVASVLKEFLWQKSLDFYLEGQRQGDFRRHPEAMTGLPVPGAAYFKPGFPAIADKVCYPLPITEIDNNPNLKGT